MTKTLIAMGAVLVASSVALADSGSPGAAGADASKAPATHKPDEKKIKKEIADFIQQNDEAEKQGDFEKALGMVDFPVYMVTDDSKGVPSTKTVDRDAYTAMMKPFWTNMPKDSKTVHKPTVSVLSSSLVNVIDDFSMTAGGHKMTGRDQSILVKRDGQWKWKVMTEAGWGDAPPTASTLAPGDVAPSSATSR